MLSNTPAARKRRALTFFAAPFLATALFATPGAQATVFPDFPSLAEELAAYYGPPQTFTASALAAPQAVIRDDGYTVKSGAETISYTAGFSLGDSNIRWPFAGATMTDSFGPRSCDMCSPFHHGLDFAPGDGTPIPVVADGIVSTVAAGHASYGTYVIVDHIIDGEATQTLYAHMRAGSVTVAVGQVVRAGDPLGLVGSTGQSSGPHLHFEVRPSGVVVDPFPWLLGHASS